MKTITMNMLLAFTIFSSGLLSGHAKAQVVRDLSKYNLENSIGLKGYDPVSYFSEGGSSPLKGVQEYGVTHEGVTYLFANPEHMKLFILNPNKFEPTYGGWCAYAMAFGSQVDINPNYFTVHGNRLHFFVSKRAKQNFDSDVADHEAKADGFWKAISGEEPRL